jgi:hypothetical protein
VDEKGKPTTVIDFDSDDDGMQWIYFWMKGKHVRDDVIASPTIRTRTADEENSFMEEEISDNEEEDGVLKAEMDQKFTAIQRQMQAQNEVLQQQLQALMGTMQQQHLHYEQQQQQQQHFEQQQHHHQQQPPPIPDQQQSMF